MTIRSAVAILLFLFGLVGLGAGAAGASATEPVAASASSADSCDPATDVVVTVDASTTGGEYTSLCVTDADGRSALDVLKAAGLPVVVTAGSGGMVCRIDGQPTPEQETCGASLSGDGYWAFFTATVDGAWTYAQEGPATSEVAGGQLVTFQYTSLADTDAGLPSQDTSADAFASTALVPAEQTGDGADDTAGEAGEAAEGGSATTVVVTLVVGVLVAAGAVVLVLRRRAQRG